MSTLVLEHVERLPHVFREARRVLRTGGRLFVGELHPCRQIGGTQPNFEHEASGETFTVPAFRHSISAFINDGLGVGLAVQEIGEWHGPDDEVQRLLTILFKC